MGNHVGSNGRSATMKMKLLIGVLLFLIVVNLATIGTYLYVRFAHRSYDPRESGPPAGRPFPREMGLSEDQRNRLFDLIHGFHEETRELGMRIHDLERATFALLQENPVPQERVDSVFDEICKARLEMSKRATKKMIEAKAFLTPAQQEH